MKIVQGTVRSCRSEWTDPSSPGTRRFRHHGPTSRLPQRPTLARVLPCDADGTKQRHRSTINDYGFHALILSDGPSSSPPTHTPTRTGARRLWSETRAPPRPSPTADCAPSCARRSRSARRRHLRRNGLSQSSGTGPGRAPGARDCEGRTSPLCCRRRRGGSTVKPMYVRPLAVGLRERKR